MPRFFPCLSQVNGETLLSVIGGGNVSKSKRTEQANTSLFLEVTDLLAIAFVRCRAQQSSELPPDRKRNRLSPAPELSAYTALKAEGQTP